MGNSMTTLGTWIMDEWTGTLGGRMDGFGCIDVVIN